MNRHTPLLTISILIVSSGVLQAANTLIPGNGFDGQTTQPAPTGEPGDFGREYAPIARWDLVPYQEIAEEFLLGVVAIHSEGIRQVDFSLEGGPWVSVTQMTREVVCS